MARLDATPGDETYIASQGGISDGNGWFFGWPAGVFVLRFQFGGVAAYDDTSDALASGLHTYGISVSGNGGNVRFFKNGEFLSQVSVGTMLASAYPLRFNAVQYSGGSFYGNSKLGIVAIFKSAFADAGHAEFHRDPYAIVRLQRVRLARIAATQGAGGPTGTGAATSPAATTSGTGRVIHKPTGTPAATAPAATSSGTGRLVHDGSGAATAPAATASGAGRLIHDGSGTGTAPAATASGSGKLVHDGSGSGTAAPATSAGAGKLVHKGTGSATASAATSSGSALTIGVQTGSGSATAPAATSSGAGRVVHKASGSATAPAATSGGMAEQAGGTAGGGKGGRGYRRRRRNHDGDGHGSVGSTLRRHDAPQPRVAAPRAVVAPAVLMALAFDDYEL